MEERSRIRRLSTPHGSVSLRLDEPAGDMRALVFLAHGAGGHLGHPGVAALSDGLVARGFSVLRFNFPYAEAGRRRPDPEPVLLETWIEVLTRGFPGRSFPGIPRIAAGRSMGGRMASLAAARRPDVFDPEGLVLFAYPLHPPGRPDRPRTEHLARIGIPVLFLSGTRDTFLSVGMMERAAGLPPRATLHWLAGADHGFAVQKRSGRTGGDVRDEAVDAVVQWVGASGIAAAAGPGPGSARRDVVMPLETTVDLRDIVRFRPSDPGYPERVLEVPGRARILRVLGDLEALSVGPLLAVVGRRSIDEEIQRTTRRLVDTAAEFGMVVLSGISPGVDLVAHEAALAKGLRTVAVPGSGLEPLLHSDRGPLAERILDAGGLIISPFPTASPETAERRWWRNRLIAALCHGMVVVASESGGGELEAQRWARQLERRLILPDEDL